MKILFGLLGCLLAVTSAMPTTSQSDGMMNDSAAMDYLMKYGYAGSSNPDPRIAELVQTDMSMAREMGIKMFQTRYGLQVTGTMNDETSRLMNMSRCGNKDIMTMDDSMPMDGSSKRRKRFAAQGKWNKNRLTYRVLQYTQDNDLSNAEVDRQIARAFQVWADVANLEFVRLSSGTPDIIITFNAFSHGDGNAFDGPSGVLAHAYLPINGNGVAIEGDTHFDESEVWTINGNRGIDLFQVAAHEFGHALGLGHSSDQSALMAPFYQGYIPDFRLPLDDTLGIQSIYGARDETDDTDGDMGGMDGSDEDNGGGETPVTFPPGMPNFCANPRIDAITRHVEDGSVRFEIFQGEYYARLADNGIEQGYPKAVEGNWPGFSGSVDAALYLEGYSRTYWQWSWSRYSWEQVTETTPAHTFLFSGSEYYAYTDDMTLEVDGRPISELGLPSDLDAIFVWAGNNRIYAMKGSQYYRLSRSDSNPMLSVDSNYPRDISIWNLPFSTVDAALKTASSNYFFSGNNFYLYDNINLQVASGYPRPITDIYGCSSNLEDMGNDNDGTSAAPDAQSMSHLSVMMASCLSLLAVLCVF